MRAQFALQPADEVRVSQDAGTLPGCPPLETIITFWTDEADGSTSRHHCKVFKPAHAVGAEDLPPRWMKQALRVAPGYGCDCC